VQIRAVLDFFRRVNSCYDVVMKLISRLTLPVKVGLGFGLAGLLLTVIGIVRGQVPLAPLNVAIALVIGGGVWFVVAWAVATAAVDVEREIGD